ncbi:MAG: MarR family transcriptional regulator [Acidimicrobiia bacterium]|nr:MarR family transcriptional regulator [Acidimicrobiia bacterium]
MNPALTLMDEVRLLMHAAARFVEELHTDLDVSTPERAVLEFLVRNGSTTVPDIARARGVSRQHIQTIVNGLLARSLVQTAINPAHRRSSLLVLTAGGSALIEEMLDRERLVMADRLEGITEASMTEAADVLAAVRSRL